MRSERRSARDRREHADAARAVANVNLPRAWDQAAGHHRRPGRATAAGACRTKSGESDGEGRYYAHARSSRVRRSTIHSPSTLTSDAICGNSFDARHLALRQRTVGVDEDGAVELAVEDERLGARPRIGDHDGAKHDAAGEVEVLTARCRRRQDVVRQSKPAVGERRRQPIGWLRRNRIHRRLLVVGSLRLGVGDQDLAIFRQRRNDVGVALDRLGRNEEPDVVDQLGDLARGVNSRRRVDDDAEAIGQVPIGRRPRRGGRLSRRGAGLW